MTALSLFITLAIMLTIIMYAIIVGGTRRTAEEQRKEDEEQCKILTQEYVMRTNYKYPKTK